MCSSKKEISMGAPSIEEFIRKFKDEKTARDYLLKLIFPNGELVCPYCGNTEKMYICNKKGRRKPTEFCGHCKRELIPFSGTMFENTRIPYRTWLQVIYSMFISRRSVSSRQLVRETNISERSIYHIRRLVQMAMGNYDLQPFAGVIEMDEVYLGGSNHGRYNRNKEDREKKKYPVFGIVEEDTRRVYSHVAIPNEKGQYLTSTQIKDFVEKTCKPGSTIVSDEWKSYRVLDKKDSQYHHEAVDHNCEWMNKNGYYSSYIESYWSEIKKMYYGTHSFFTKQYAHFYLNEADFRHNHRDWEEALETIIKQSVFTPRVIDIRRMGRFGNRTYDLKDYRMILPARFDKIPLEHITVKDILNCDEPVYGILRIPYLSRKKRRMGEYVFKEEWSDLGYIKGGNGYKDYRSNVINSRQDVADMIKDATKSKEVNNYTRIIYSKKEVPKEVLALRSRRIVMKRRYERMPQVIQQQIKREYPQIFDCTDAKLNRKIHDRITSLIYQYKKYIEATDGVNEIKPRTIYHSPEERRVQRMKKRYDNLPKDVQETIITKYPNILEVKSVKETVPIHQELNHLMQEHKIQVHLTAHNITKEEYKKNKELIHYFKKRYKALPDPVRLQIALENPNVLEITNKDEIEAICERMNALVKVYKNVLGRAA